MVINPQNGVNAQDRPLPLGASLVVRDSGVTLTVFQETAQGIRALRIRASSFHQLNSVLEMLAVYREYRALVERQDQAFASLPSGEALPAEVKDAIEERVALTGELTDGLDEVALTRDTQALQEAAQTLARGVVSAQQQIRRYDLPIDQALQEIAAKLVAKCETYSINLPQQLFQALSAVAGQNNSPADPSFSSVDELSYDLLKMFQDTDFRKWFAEYKAEERKQEEKTERTIRQRKQEEALVQKRIETKKETERAFDAKIGNDAKLAEHKLNAAKQSIEYAREADITAIQAQVELLKLDSQAIKSKLIFNV